MKSKQKYLLPRSKKGNVKSASFSLSLVIVISATARSAL